MQCCIGVFDALKHWNSDWCILLNFLSGEEVAEPPEKVFSGETQPLENASKDNVTTPSGYAAFMQAFRSFHESSLQVLLSYWPAVRSATRDVLAYVGLDSVSIEHFKPSLLYQNDKINWFSKGKPTRSWELKISWSFTSLLPGVLFF